MEALTRDRDLLPTLAEIPWGEAVRSCTGHSHAALRAIVENTNDTIRRVRALACGEVVLAKAPHPVEWWAAREPQREVARSVLARWASWQPDLEAAPSPQEALSLLGGHQGGAYHQGRDPPGGDPSGTRLNKGAICPIDVEQVSLPPPGTKPISIAAASPTAAAYLEEFRSRMLRERSQVDWESYAKQQVYSDEVFTRQSELLRLCERMWEAGMLGFSRERHAEVSAFGVVKGYKADGSLAIRAVWDERKPNILWQEPPFIPLGSPATLCHVDLSFLPEDALVYSAVGDMPDWFYRLQLPREMWGWFAVKGVELPEFLAFMQERGHVLPDPGDATALCVTVLVMGWSWAPFLAHTTLTDLLDGVHGLQSKERRMVYGVPCPQWDPDRPEEWSPLTWAYIDDYGALQISHPTDTPGSAQEEIEAWASKTRSSMARKGLPVHKEKSGPGLDAVLGAALSGRPYHVSVPKPKMAMLIKATSALLEMVVIPGKALERLMGQWSWALLMRRQALAILGQAYRWVQTHRLSQAPLPQEVHCELRMLMALGPWMGTNLECPWLRTVFATDASMEGYGVVATTANLHSIRSEARFAETKGWTVCMNDTHDDIEEAAWAAPESDRAVDTFEEALSSKPPPAAPRTRVFRVAHLFSGHRRKEDLEWWLRELAPTYGVTLEVWSIDVSIDPSLDLTKPAIVDYLVTAFAAGFFHAAVGGPPCSTWSRVRFRKGGGPRPLRTRAEPWGRTDVDFTPSEARKVELGTKLLCACVKLFEALSAAGGVFVLEHPRDPGVPPFPSIWDLPLTKDLSERTGAETIDLDQCMFGQRAQKGTFIMTNGSQARRFLEKRCCHSSHDEVLVGVNADGSFRTAAAQTYPSGLCRAIAETILSDLSRMSSSGTGPDPECRHPTIDGLRFPAAVPGRSRPERRFGERVPAPPLSGEWLPISRWRLVYKGTWREREHITIQELRTGVGVLRHLSRSRQSWGRRVLILMDSMAALGVLSKGRSSSPPLLRLARQAAAISLIFDIYPVVRYIPSEVNPADGPSRGVGVGAAPETRAAHSDRLAVSFHEALAKGRNSPLNDAEEVARLLAGARACSGYAGG